MTLSLQELRVLAERRHEAATAKAYRLRKQGVKVTGSAIDPRVDRGLIKRYTRKQLQGYIKKIDSFTDRNVQFVPGRGGVPLSRSVVESFERTKVASNIRAQKFLQPNIDRVLPTTNITVGQRLDDLAAREFNVMRMGKGVSNLPHDINTQTAKDFGSEKSIKTAEKALKKRLKPRYLKTKIGKGRVSANKMLNTINRPDIAKMVEGLSDEQFNLVWNFTSLPTGLATNYEAIKEGESARHVDKISHDNMLEARELIEWASKQKF